MYYLPRAISTSEGELNKGTKATTTTFYESATKKQLHCWAPLVVIMNGMFLINIAPWDAHKTIGSYADFSIEMGQLKYILFDNPKSLSLKQFKRLKRDRLNPIPDSHYCRNSVLT